MEFGRTLEISASGLRAQRLRLDVVASNLANANATRNADGTGPYRRRAVVFRSAPLDASFEQALESSTHARALRTVEVSRIAEDESTPRMVHDPEHPDANPDGYVAYPNINTVAEMVDLMTATRSYEANVQAIRALRAMSEAALTIGARGQ
jgi:flagellar basal-body rod protein FlgC